MPLGIYKTISEIYSHLQDDESREIFRLRSLYSMTGEVEFFNEYVRKNSARQSIEKSSNKNAYIFGCGVHGKRLFETINKEWRGFVDNNSNLWGCDISGLKIIPPDELPRDATVYLAVKWHQEEIKEQLISLGISEDNIVNIGELLIELSNQQYFDGPFLSHVEDEVFVDVGCLNGESSRNFIKWSQERYKHIYCFEADPHNTEKCKKQLKDLFEDGKLTLITKAVSDKNGVASFIMCQNGTSKIGAGDMQVETVSLDSILLDKNPTFIKMDIEGGEYLALKGAKRIISELHPKLAISVYHLPSDIFDIPALLLSYYPGYKFYLRHYSPYVEETVLYAI